MLAVNFLYNDALIVTMNIDNSRVSRIPVDSWSNVNILYGGAVDKMEDTQRQIQL